MTSRASGTEEARASGTEEMRNSDTEYSVVEALETTEH